MAIDTYANLKAAVAAWLHRDDLTDEIPDFIRLAESRIKSMLVERTQDIRSSLTTTASLPYVDLPEDFRAMRSLSIPVIGTTLKYVTPEQALVRSADGQAGLPLEYTIVGGQLQLIPIPDAEYSMVIIYRASFQALSDATPTNMLLVSWPDVYLWGALKEAADFSRDEALAQKADARFLTAINAINADTWNSPAGLSVAVDTYTP